MTVAPGTPSLISCTSKGVPMNPKVRARESGVRIYASCDARGPLFTLQEATRGRWASIEASRSLESLFTLASGGLEHPRADDFAALLAAGEVVYERVEPETFVRWFEARFTRRSRCAAALGMTTRNLARYLNGSQSLPWSTWVALNALDAAQRADEAASFLADVGDPWSEHACAILSGGG